MAKVKIVDRPIKMSRWDIIKFQLITHCYTKRIAMSESDLECLTLLGYQGESDLSEFCEAAAERGIFKGPQTVRNCLNKADKNGLISKARKSKKRVALSSDLQVQTVGNILLNYKVAHFDT
jgi:hypothetical protein